MKCIACGAEIEFSPDDERLKCSYCGSLFDASSYLNSMKSAKEVKEPFNDNSSQEMVSKSYTCTQCGAKLLTFSDTAITFCSYCDSSNVIESELYKGEAPEFVIPFKITKDECEKIYKKEIKKHIFAPREMMDDVIIKKFRGIYMPYGIYKATHHGVQVNKGDKYDHRSGYYDYYYLYDISCDINAEYDGMSYDLSSNFYDKLSQAISPFDYREAVPFNLNYLSGYYADSRDVNKEIYNNDAKQVIGPDSEKELLKYKEFRHYGCKHPHISYEISDMKVAYYPVYFLAVRNKKNDTVNYAVINGQTGKIAVELPIDFKKYVIFTFILALPIFLIFNVFFTLSPRFMLFVSIVLAIINIFLANNQRSELKKRESHSDDKGYANVQKSMLNFDDKSKDNGKLCTILNIISIVICIGMFFINPIDDNYFYFVSILSLIMILISFKCIINQFNQLTSRKLSQIGIRGGDESEV